MQGPMFGGVVVLGSGPTPLTEDDTLEPMRQLTENMGDIAMTDQANLPKG